MSKIERYQGDVKAFASNAQGLERTVFGGTTQANDLTSQVTAAFLRGWGIVGPSEHPSLEDFNAAMYAMSQFIAYQHQVGVPEWHAEQEYHSGSVCTHGGVSYQSLDDENIGDEPPSAKWTPVLTAKNGGEFFQPKNANLSALAGLAGAANRLPYFTAANTLALTALTAFARELLSQNDAAGVLTKLGLGSQKYGAPMIGELVMWSQNLMPQEIWPDCGMEFIPYRGQSFDPVRYPLLSQLHPTNVLPADMRGYSPRGWDWGRGIDAGRVLMSTQEDSMQNVTGSISSRSLSPTGLGAIAGSSGVFTSVEKSDSSTGVVVSTINQQQKLDLTTFDLSRVARTSTETRSKNVAWNFIVRAK